MKTTGSMTTLPAQCAPSPDNAACVSCKTDADCQPTPLFVSTGTARACMNGYCGTLPRSGLAPATVAALVCLGVALFLVAALAGFWAYRRLAGRAPK